MALATQGRQITGYFAPEPFVSSMMDCQFLTATAYPAPMPRQPQLLKSSRVFSPAARPDVVPVCYGHDRLPNLVRLTRDVANRTARFLR